MRITEAASRLGTSPRMLRYRESLGLLPPTKEGSTAPGTHRRFGDAELRAVSLALAIERRYGIGPAELAFGLRALADPDVRAQVRELGERIGRISAPPTRALDFEKEKALRLLRARRATDPHRAP
jgi:MerR family transcriptional regulator, copper efflux regulator